MNYDPSFTYPVDVIFDASDTSEAISANYTPENGGGPDLIYALTLGALQLPADFVGTSITILASFDGVTFLPIYDSATSADYSVNVAASKHIPLDPVIVFCAKSYKIKSSAAETTTIVAGLRSVR